MGRTYKNGKKGRSDPTGDTGWGLTHREEGQQLVTPHSTHYIKCVGQLWPTDSPCSPFASWQNTISFFKSKILKLPQETQLSMENHCLCSHRSCWTPREHLVWERRFSMAQTQPLWVTLSQACLLDTAHPTSKQRPSSHSPHSRLDCRCEWWCRAYLGKTSSELPPYFWQSLHIACEQKLISNYHISHSPSPSVFPYLF